MVRAITAGDPETSDLLRYMYVAHLEPERIDREYHLGASYRDPETWERRNLYFDSWNRQAGDRLVGFTGPGDG